MRICSSVSPLTPSDWPLGEPLLLVSPSGGQKKKRMKQSQQVCVSRWLPQQGKMYIHERGRKREGGGGGEEKNYRANGAEKCINARGFGEYLGIGRQSIYRGETVRVFVCV